MSSKKKKALIGETFINKYGMKFSIIDYDKNDRTIRIIQFENGTIQRANVGKIKNGCNIYDRNVTPTVFGVGINDVEGGATHILYDRWMNMVGRCYSNKHAQYKNYGAKGVVVEEYLLKFSNYISFISNLENYELLISKPNEYQIDKDIKNGRQSIYSRETISIVKSEDNLEEENKNKRISIARYSLDGKFIDSFESISEAERLTNIHRGNIARCVRGESKTAGGYIWVNLAKNK